MNICLITIGIEVLTGKTLDTNFAYIASCLELEGYQVTCHLCLPDEKSILLKKLKEALDQNDVLILTGGLGPTIDDLTKDVLTELFHDHLILNQAVHEKLKLKYGHEHPAICGQADVPSKANLMPNDLGTAPGLIFHEKGKLVAAMPGVPQEMQHMLDHYLMAYLKTTFSSTPYLVASLHMCHVYESLIDPFLRELDLLYPEVQKGIYPRYGTLSVTFKVESKLQDAAEQLQACLEKVEHAFSTYIYSKKSPSIALAVHELLQEKKKKLMLAESCSGGAIASKLTQFSGSSEYFLGSVVAYDNLIKSKILNVRSETIKSYGAVSSQVAIEMADGALALTDADYAASVTGIAGPSGGSSEKPVGTVFFSLATKGKISISHKITIRAFLKRDVVIDYSANYVLGALWRYIRHGVSTFE